MEGAALPNNVDAVLDQIEVTQAVERFELEPNATSLKFLQTIYRSPSVPLSTRMRAAIAALQFEHPKLAVMATIDGGDFGERLENAVKRSSEVIEAVPAIEAKPTTDPALKPMIPDRRYRRGF
jgi:hypothetical protein